MSDGLEKQDKSRDLRIVNKQLTDFANPCRGFVPDRDVMPESKTKRCAARQHGSNDTATLRNHRETSGRQFIERKRRICGAGKAGVGRYDAHAIWSDHQSISTSDDVLQPVLPRQSFRARLCKAIREYGDCSNTGLDTLRQRIESRVCRQ